jgi:four helix bundle protein
VQRFTKLLVWPRSHRLAVDIYRETRAFPSDERFGMVSQIRRAIVSVSSNIAEGAKRRSNQDYARLLNLAEGSLAETESLLHLASDLEFGSPENIKALQGEADEISRMLHALRASVEANVERARSRP